MKRTQCRAIVLDQAQTGRLYWYVNGARVEGSGVAADATNFPDGEELVPIVMIKTGEATGKALKLHWWAMAQLY